MRFLDVTFYRNFHLDLKSMGLSDEELILQYKEYGCVEGRLSSEAEFYEFYIDFDLELYNYNYPDLCVFNGDKYLLMWHYHNLGFKEGRICMKFDPTFYNNFHLDIKSLHLSEEQLKESYESYGKKEGRICCETDFYALYPEFDFESYKNNYPDLSVLNGDKYMLMWHYHNFGCKEGRIGNIIFNTAVIFHVGNIDIFNEIYLNYFSFFQNKNILYFITLHSLKDKEFVESKLSNTIITIIENTGMDIGGKLISIKNILNYPSYHSINNFFFINTKTNKEWREKMLSPLLNCYDELNNFTNKINNQLPILVGSYDYTMNNTKSINRKYIQDIFKRNFVDSNIFSLEEINKFMDEYIYDLEDSTFDKDIFKFNSDFYKNYEFDLKNFNNEQLLEHYNYNGKYEFHRMPNPCYLKKKGVDSFFAGGSCFYTNRAFIDIFKNINLDYEFDLLEEGYIKNDTPKKTHAWEYFFGYLCYIYKSNMYSITNKGEIINRLNEEQDNFTLQSIIYINPSKSKIAFFMLIPNLFTMYAGGYKTLLNYIKVLEDNNIYCDLYFGESTNDMNIKHNGLSSLNNDIYELVYCIDRIGIIDISKHNFFLGLNVQRKYDIIVANAWQISESVWLNRNDSKEIAYIIQDEEALFYPHNLGLQENVKKTYKKEFKYYCLSNYLNNVFSKDGFDCLQSILGVNLNNYYNLNYGRQKTVIISYFKSKIGRLPELIEKLIEIISTKYVCLIFPDEYTKTCNENIINIGSKSIIELNEIYNNSSVGIIMSNTNPSRIGFEMLASGLRVIEYDSKFTELDMPNQYFNKIKNSDNILNLIETLMNSEYNYPVEYVKNISCEIENNKCLHFFQKLLGN